LAVPQVKEDRKEWVLRKKQHRMNWREIRNNRTQLAHILADDEPGRRKGNGGGEKGKSMRLPNTMGGKKKVDATDHAGVVRE